MEMENSSPRDLWYPSLIVHLSSEYGRTLFSESLHTVYDRLQTNFEPQEHASYCGIASACMILNTLLPYRRWTQANLYSDVAREHMLNGITLAKLSHVLDICGLPSTIHYCEDETIEKQFRNYLQNPDNYIIINYWRQFEVKDRNYVYRGGHFSVIGAYHMQTDNILIMDTSQTKFPHHWLPLKDLVRMMKTNDKMSGRSRGYLVINSLQKL